MNQTNSRTDRKTRFVYVTDVYSTLLRDITALIDDKDDLSKAIDMIHEYAGETEHSTSVDERPVGRDALIEDFVTYWSSVYGHSKDERELRVLQTFKTLANEDISIRDDTTLILNQIVLDVDRETFERIRTNRAGELVELDDESQFYIDRASICFIAKK